jgi:predicted molibdopterin-dependent oxidoreductase YjgC
MTSGDLRVPPPDGPDRGPAFTFRFDGAAVRAHPGETIGAALLAAGIRTLRTTRAGGRPRGLLCGIGQCFDCLVTVDGLPSQRACLTPAAPGQEVEVQDVPQLG